MELPLAGKSLVVIGGTTGLGVSATRAFVKNGARVVAIGRNPESCRALERELGERVCAIPADACTSNAAAEAIAEAISRFGRFDGLYHVAGGSGRSFGDGPLHELTDAGWELTFTLNLTSLMFSNRAAVRQFLAQGTGGSILNMSSVLAFSPSPQHFATHAYAAAKAAAIGFSKAIAAYYAPQNIRVNVVAPALVETPMAQRAASDETILRFIKLKQPLDGGRIGQAADLDAAAVYFMSEGAKFCTGQVLSVDGGWSVSDGERAE